MCLKRFDCSYTDILQVDVVVCSSSKNLDLNRGRASKALLDIAGEEMKEDCEAKYPDGIEYGEVAMVCSGNIACKKAYFIALPVWGTGHDEQQVCFVVLWNYLFVWALNLMGGFNKHF